MKYNNYFLCMVFLVVALPALYAQQPIGTTWKPLHNITDWSVANAHSHNDYQQSSPFTAAYAAQFGSIEADIFLYKDSLYVGHELKDIGLYRTLGTFYLQPLASQIQQHGGYPYADTTRTLQLLIDIKTTAIPTLQLLIKQLQNFKAITHCTHLNIVITGNRPPVNTWASYPDFIYFDGNVADTYPASLLPKIAMLSASLEDFTAWNGKGRLNTVDSSKLARDIQTAHNQGKKIRFWAAPDFINAWLQLMHMGIDWINTDHIPELALFMNRLKQDYYEQAKPQPIYTPTYAVDGKPGKVKNVILLIGDGMALPQLYTGYVANHAQLNVFALNNIGLSKTSSLDNFITDSAPGASAFATGEKSKNRSIGVDGTGRALPLLPEILHRNNIVTGLISSGDITDATPAAFYAHNMERDSSVAIYRNLKQSPIKFLLGAGNEHLENIAILKEKNRPLLSGDILHELTPAFTIANTIDSFNPNAGNRMIVVDKQAGLSMQEGRGNWLQTAFEKGLASLSASGNGFFLMTEGAQIDYGGHANNIGYVAEEMLDFDQLVGKALAFADSNNETLVIVTADHETGGLTLVDGDYSTGRIGGHFATSDHTALPVMVFAYGPGAQNFSGVYENTALFGKILAAFGIKQ